MPRFIAYGVGIILLLVIVGGVGYKLIAPTNKTVIGQGGRQVIVNTDKPQVPLGGCSIWRVSAKLYWEKGFRLNDEKPKEVKK